LAEGGLIIWNIEKIAETPDLDEEEPAKRFEAYKKNPALNKSFHQNVMKSIT
jgi:hypothetical protein